MRRGLGFHARHSPGLRFSPEVLFAGGVQGAWFDPSDPTTLFSDRAGTTPCAAPGAGAVVPVGAMLDKRASGYSVFFDGTGDSLTAGTTSTFNFMHNASALFTFECWVYRTVGGVGQTIFSNVNSSLNIGAILGFTSGNNLFIEIYRGVSSSFIISAASSGTVPINQWTHVAVTYDQSLASNNANFYINGVFDSQATKTANAPSGSNASFAGYIGTTPAGSLPLTGYISNLRIVNAVLPISLPTAPLAPVTGTALLTCGTSWSGNPAITKNGDARVDGLNPFQASPVGNHAIAANDTTARPELSARVNLLTYSEQFDNAYWTKAAGSITATNITDPLGGSTADAFTEDATNAGRAVYPPQQTIVSGTQYTLTVCVKANGRNFARLSFGRFNTATQYAGATFDLSTGAVTASGAVGSTTLATVSAGTNLGNGWWRFTITASTNGTDGYALVAPASSGTPTLTAFGSPTYQGDGTSGIYIWGADLRPANIGTTIPAYQRVADQYTYNTVGFPRFLRAEGASRGMYTPANIPFATVTSDWLARRNLLNNPTQFDVAASWTPNSATIAANSVAAPDSSVSADSFITNAATTTANISQTASVSNGVVHTLSVYFQYNPTMATPWVEIATVSGSTLRSWFNVQTGAAGTINHTSGSVTSVGGNWYRCQVTFTSGAATVQLFFSPRPADGSIGAITGNGTNPQFYIWGAQLETGSTATAFQNIGTDKVTVFAGVRKQSDAALGVIMESSATIASNNGAFLLSAPNSAAANYNFSSKGTTQVDNTVTTFTAPLSSVLSGQGNIGAPSNVIRVNGVATTVTSTQGTGNYGTYSLNLFGRNSQSGTPTAGTILNGDLYSVILVAGSTGQVAATEQWIAGKMSITI